MYVVKEQRARYEPLDTLSEGATSSVLLARDHLMDRLVAIKSIKLTGVHDPEERQRLGQSLRNEAQLVQILSHPNIVAVHDLLEGDQENPPSLVLEYVPGSTLESFLKAGKPLPIDFVLPLVLQVGQALEHAHSMGVVHGDVKPANILVSDATEQAKLFDFGIASSLAHEAHASRRPMGTPRYVAPEILLGQPADPRSDLFSLTVVLYEMLTGHSPFRGETSEEITQQIARGTADLSDQVLAEVPEVLVPVLRKGLARDPAARFQSATEFLEAIQSPAAPAAPSRPTDAAATQDLTELVVPEIPDPEETAEVVPTEVAGSASTAPPRHPRHARSGFEMGGSTPRRLLWLGLLTALIGTASALGIYRLVVPVGPPNGHPSAAHLRRTKIFPLLQETQRQLLAGEPEVAARILLRAETLAPDRVSIPRLRERIEREARLQESQRMFEEELSELLTESRRALDRGRPGQARRLATQALSLDPQSPEAEALIEAAEIRLRRPSEAAPKTAKAEVASRAQPPPRSQEPPQRVTAPAPTPVTPPPIPSQTPPRAVSDSASRPESGIANLRVDVFSYLPKGVLTVYADQEQVLLQPFRFVQKSGFLRRKKTAGRLETSIEVPSGDTEFRIYVSAEGQETQSVNLTADLTGGETHVLRLIIAENGSASAQLN